MRYIWHRTDHLRRPLSNSHPLCAEQLAHCGDEHLCAIATHGDIRKYMNAAR
jgi:hypothetical protein